MAASAAREGERVGGGHPLRGRPENPPAEAGAGLTPTTRKVGQVAPIVPMSYGKLGVLKHYRLGVIIKIK